MREYQIVPEKIESNQIFMNMLVKDRGREEEEENRQSK
jgi:hypothetical protein